MTEHQEQTQLFKWSKDQENIYPELEFMFAIGNEGIRGKGNSVMRYGAMRKRLGVKAGVPDILLPVSNGKSHGLFIEMKRQKVKADKSRGVKGVYPKASPEQREWLSALSSMGYSVYIAYGWEDAKEAILDYLEGKVFESLT